MGGHAYDHSIFNVKSCLEQVNFNIKYRVIITMTLYVVSPRSQSIT